MVYQLILNITGCVFCHWKSFGMEIAPLRTCQSINFSSALYVSVQIYIYISIFSLSSREFVWFEILWHSFLRQITKCNEIRWWTITCNESNIYTAARSFLVGIENSNIQKHQQQQHHHPEQQQQAAFGYGWAANEKCIKINKLRGVHVMRQFPFICCSKPNERVWAWARGEQSGVLSRCLMRFGFVNI